MPPFLVDPLLLAALALFAAAALLVAGLGHRLSAERRIRHRLGSVRVAGRWAEARPSGRGAEAVCRALRFSEADLAETGRLVSRAGLGGGVRTAAWFLLARAGFAVAVASVAGLGYWGGWLRGLPLLLLLAGGLFGFLVPRLLLGWLGAARSRRIHKELPVFIDTLVLMLRSGASLDQALRTLAQQDEAAFPEIGRATRSLVEDLENGLGHDEAMERWADRLGGDAVHELAQMFILHLQAGSEIARRLKQFAELFVEQRLLDARERGGRRITQLTVTAMLFFVPPLILTIAGPGVDALIKGIGAIAQGTAQW